MIAYSVIMFAIAVLFFGLAVAIYKGNTNLIHDYHQTHVKEIDRKKYGESFSKGLFVLTVSLIFSGITALFGTTGLIVILSISVLFVGMIISLIILAKVQKEFNGGF